MNENQISDEIIPPPPERLRTRNSTPRDYGDEVQLPSERVETASSSRSTYQDEMGDPTYYYLNVSNGKVRITDLDVTLAAGAPVDLLDLADEDKILKSKDLRNALKSRPDVEPLLRRLTNDEFDRLYSKWINTQHIIKQKKDAQKAILEAAEKNPKEIKKLSNQRSEDDLNIRPQVVSLVNKLRLGNLNVNEKEAQALVESKEAGITAEEFLLKFEVLKPTNDEVDYVYTSVMDKKVRTELKDMFHIEE